jgi:uncharacterized protein YeaO (DUF488 family)/DNA-binding MarR family transcriptional regulator
LSDAVYTRLLALRTGLRQFERWSEQQAQAAGLTPAQHQLLLAIRGHQDPRGPTIRDVADYLLLRHHSVVGLVDRADAAGLVRRERDDQDHRVVRLRLTTAGAARLEKLSALHLEELERLAARLPRGGSDPMPVDVRIARAYDLPARSAGQRVLVDRLWPRGVSKSTLGLAAWMKDVAPSTELRKWYGHAADRFDEFARRYRAELHVEPAAHALDELHALASRADVVLVTATHELELSAAVVLRDVLAGK